MPAVSAPSEPRTLVMHGLRLKGFAEAASVAEVATVDEAAAVSELNALVDEGLATHRSGRISGFSLTPAGRADHARRLSAELEALGVREAIETTYRSFLTHNGRLLAVCTAWQLREVNGQSIPNDHTDAAYDAQVIAQLGELHAIVAPICVELAASLDRYGRYGPQLSHALERVQAGELEWFTKPMVDSYHTVWFELHEDLLATLGIERGTEEPS